MQDNRLGPGTLQIGIRYPQQAFKHLEACLPSPVEYSSSQGQTLRARTTDVAHHAKLGILLHVILGVDPNFLFGIQSQFSHSTTATLASTTDGWTVLD